MADQRASGKLTYNIEVDSAEAYKNIAQLKGQVRAIHRDWKGQYQVLQANNKEMEANSVRIKGLKQEYEAQNKVLEQSQNALDKYNHLAGDHSVKINKLKQTINNLEAQLGKLDNQIQSSTRYQELYSQQVRKTSENVRNQREANKQNVEMLKSQGREYEAQQAKIKGYQNSIASLTAYANSLSKSMTNYATTAKTSLQDDKNFQIVNNRYKSVLTQIQNVKNEAFNTSLGLNNLNETSKEYNNTTNAIIDRSKTESGRALANRNAYERLSQQRKYDIDLHNAQIQKMERVGELSGKNSNAYQKEKGKLAEVDSQFTQHSKALNEAGRGYQNLSYQEAKSLDKIDRVNSKLKTSGMNAMSLAHHMTMASIGIGGAFVYGAKENNELQDRFIKTQNLLTTSGENEQHVHKNVQQMQKDTHNNAVKWATDQKEIANGYEELVRRGYDSNQALAAQKVYLQGSKASGDSYKDVVNNGASAIEAFGMKSENSRKMFNNTKTAINQMSYAADLTAGDFNSIGESMKYVGATAHSTNQTLSETSSAIGVLNNNGESGSLAGTGLRKVLNSFSSISTSGRSKQGQVLDQLGLSKQDFQDKEGHIKSLSDLMQIMNDHMQGYSDADRADIFHNFFGTTGQESAKILAANVGQIKDLNGQISKSQDQNQGKGYISNIADKNMKSTKAQLESFKQSMSEVAQGFSETLLPTATKLAGITSKIGQRLANMPRPIKTVLGAIGVGVPIITGLMYAYSGATGIVRRFLKAVGGGKLLYSSMRKKHQRLANSIDEESGAYDANTASVKANTRAKEINDSVGGGSGYSGGSSGSGSGSTYSRSSRTRSGSKSSRYSNVENEAERGTETVSRDSRDLTRDGKYVRTAAKDAGTIGKFGKFAKGAGYIGDALAVIDALSSLKGINKSNIGSKIGKSGGTLGGMTAGGLGGSEIGTIGGPIGVGVGGAVGSAAGAAAGSPLGQKTGEYVQNHPWTTDSVSSKLYDRYKKNQDQKNVQMSNPKTGVNANNIMSEFAQTQVRSNARDHNDNSQSSVDMVKQNQDAYKKMGSQLDDYNNKTSQKSKSNLEYLAKIGAISQQDVQNGLNNSTKARDKNISKAKKSLSDLSDSEDSNGKKRQQAMSKAEANIAKSLSNNSNNQKIILGQLNDSTKKISDKQAGQLIRSSYKSMKSTVDHANEAYQKSKDKANKKYKSTTNAANQEYYVNHSISKKQYDKITGNAEQEKKDSIKSARDKKNGTVDQARDQHSKVVTEANNQSKDHLQSIDSETGQGLSKWQTYVKKVKEAIGSLKDFIHDFVRNPVQTMKKALSGDYSVDKNDAPSQVPSSQHSKVMKQAGFDKKDYGQLNYLINKESSWNTGARNPNGGAYGLGQAKDSNKEDLFSGKYGKNPATNPNTQMNWLNHYIKSRYGTVQKAAQHERDKGWYANGGWSKPGQMSIFGEDGQEIAINPKRKSADKWIGEAIQARVKADSSSKWNKLASSVNDLSSSNMNSSLNSNSKVVKMVMNSLDYMMNKVSSHNQSNNGNDDYIKELKQDNKRKDAKINKILDKMDNLIDVIQNKPVITEAQIYHANRKQNHSVQKQRNMIQGNF